MASVNEHNGPLKTANMAMFAGLEHCLSELCQGLDSCLKDPDKKYADKVYAVVGAWTRLASFSDTQGGPSQTFDLDKAVETLYSYTVRLVLLGEWSKLAPALKTHLSVTLKKAAAVLNARGNTASAELCTRLITLVEDPWGNDVLSRVFSGQESITPEEGSKFCQSETPTLLTLRLELLCESKCEVLALRLIAVIRQYLASNPAWLEGCSPTLKQDWTDLYLALLFHFKKQLEIIAELKGLSVEERHALVERLWRRGQAADHGHRNAGVRVWRRACQLADFCSQCTLTAALLRLPPPPSLAALVRQWLVIQKSGLVGGSCTPKSADEQRNLTVANVKMLMEHAETSSHMYTLADVIQEEYGDSMIALCIELYVRAMALDMNYLEQRKVRQATACQTTTACQSHSNSLTPDLTQDGANVLPCPVRDMEAALSDRFMVLSQLVASQTSVCRECVLTAFSLKPTQERFLRLIELSPKKPRSSQSAEREKQGLRLEHCSSIESEPGDTPVRRNENVSGMALTPPGSGGGPGVEIGFHVDEPNKDGGKDLVSSSLLPPPPPTCLELDHNDVDSGVDMSDGGGANESTSDIISSNNEVGSMFSQEIADALGVSKHVMGDLAVVVHSPRWELLSWSLPWPELYTLCERYLSDPESVKGITTELKYLNIDYSQFKDWPKPVTRYGGIEKGYERWAEEDVPEEDELDPNGQVAEPVPDLTRVSAKGEFPAKLSAVVVGDEEELVVSSSSKMRRRKKKVIVTDSSESEEEVFRPRSREFAVAKRRVSTAHSSRKIKNPGGSCSDSQGFTLKNRGVVRKLAPRNKSPLEVGTYDASPSRSSPEPVSDVRLVPEASTNLLPNPMHKAVLYPNSRLDTVPRDRSPPTFSAQKSHSFEKKSLSNQVASCLNPMLCGLLSRPPCPVMLYKTPLKPNALEARRAAWNDKQVDPYRGPPLSRSVAILKGFDMFPVRQSTTAVHMVQIPVSNNITNPPTTNSSAVANRTTLVTANRESPLPAQSDQERPGSESANPPVNDTNSNDSNSGAVLINYNRIADSQNVPAATSTTFASTPAVSIFQVAHRPLHSLVVGEGGVQPSVGVVGVPTSTVTNARTKAGRGRGPQPQPTHHRVPANTSVTEWPSRLPVPGECFADSSNDESLASLLSRTPPLLQNDLQLNGPSNRLVRPASRSSRTNNAVEGSGSTRSMTQRVSSTTGNLSRPEDVNGVASSSISSNTVDAESGLPSRVPLVKYVDLDMVSSPSRQRAMAAVAHRRPSQGSSSGSPDPQRGGVSKRPPSSSGGANPRSPALHPPLSPAIPSPQSPALSNPHSPSHGPRKPLSFRANAMDRQSPQSSPYSRPASRSQEAPSPSDAFTFYGSRSFGDSFGAALNADSSTNRSGYTESVIVTPPPALPKFQQAFGRKTHYDAMTSSSTSGDMNPGSRDAQALPSVGCILPNRTVFTVSNRNNTVNIELPATGPLLNAVSENEASIEEEGLGSKLQSLLESALNGQISRSPTRPPLPLVQNVVRAVPPPSVPLSGPESQTRPAAPATVTKPPLPSPLFSALSSDSAHGLHSDASLSQDSMDSQSSSNPLSMLLSGPLDPLVSSSTLEQLREFESIFERVATTSQLKEQGQWNEADMESQIYMPPVAMDYLAPVSDFNASSRPPSMTDPPLEETSLGAAKTDTSVPEAATGETTVATTAESEPPIMQLLNVACAAREALKEENQTDSAELSTDTVTDDVQVKDDAESPPMSAAPPAPTPAQVVVLPAVLTTASAPSVLVKAEPVGLANSESLPRTPTTEANSAASKSRPKTSGKNSSTPSSGSSSSNVPTPVPSTSGSVGATGGKSPGGSSPTKVVVAPPKSTQKPQDDESTVLRVQAILEEYREQLRNSPDLQNKPAPRRRSNPLPSPTQTPKRRKPSQSKVKLLSQHARAGGNSDDSASNTEALTPTPETPPKTGTAQPTEKASPDAKPSSSPTVDAPAVVKQEPATTLPTLVNQAAPVSLPFTAVQPVLVTSQSGVRQVLLPVSLTAPGFRQALAAGKTSRIFSVRQVTVGGTQGYISLPARFSTPITVKTVAAPVQPPTSSVAIIANQSAPKTSIASVVSPEEKTTAASCPSTGSGTADNRMTIQALLGSQVADLLQVTPRSTTTTTVHWTNSSGVPSIGGVPIQPASQQQQASPSTSVALSFGSKQDKEGERKESQNNVNLRYVPTVNRVSLPIPTGTLGDAGALRPNTQQFQESELNKLPMGQSELRAAHVSLGLTTPVTATSVETSSDWTGGEPEKTSEEESMRLVEPGTSELLPCADLLSPGMSPQTCFVLSDSPLPSPTPSPAASLDEDMTGTTEKTRSKLNEKNRWVMGRSEHGVMEQVTRPSSAKRPTSQLALSPAISNDPREPFSIACSPIHSFSSTSQAMSQLAEYVTSSSSNPNEIATNGGNSELHDIDAFIGQQTEESQSAQEFKFHEKLSGESYSHSLHPQAGTSIETGHFRFGNGPEGVLMSPKRRASTLETTTPHGALEERITRARAARLSTASRESPIMDTRASCSDSDLDSLKRESDEDFDGGDSADSEHALARHCVRLREEESTDRGSRSDSSENGHCSLNEGRERAEVNASTVRSRRSSKRGHIRRNCPCCSSTTGTGTGGHHSPERKRSRSESVVSSPAPVVPVPKRAPETPKTKAPKKNGRKK